MDEVRRDNISLLTLAGQSLDLEPSRQCRRGTSLDAVHSVATSIFSSLRDALHPSCRSEHTASLFIEAPHQTVTNEERLRAHEGKSFRIVLHHPASVIGGLSWVREETEIKLLGPEAGVPRAGHTSSPLPTASTSSVGRRPRAPDQIPEIKDLCASLTGLQSRDDGVCVGYLTDSTTTMRHGIYRPSQHIVGQDATAVLSLGEILASQDMVRHLSTGDRRRLAAALALMMLHLHDTPWLAKQWGSKEIVFFERRGRISIDHAFLLASVACPSTSQVATSGSNLYFATNPSIVNEPLFALAVLLIELCQGKPFKELITPDDLQADGSRHPASEFFAACRQSIKISDEAGKEYGDVVRACIHCRFNPNLASLKNVAFRDAVYENVFAILQKEADRYPRV